MEVTADNPSVDWTAPGIYAVASGVYRIPLPLPLDSLHAVNVYAIEDGQDLVLIDSGWAIADARQQLQRALAGIGAELGDVSRFLITHVHQDHYTQAIALRREFGTTVALGKGEQPSLDIVSAALPADESPYAGRLRAAGAQTVLQRLAASSDGPPRAPKDWGEPDEWLADRADLRVGSRALEAIATPGHTRGHLVFRDDSAGLLFAGDHVLPHITPSIGFEAMPTEYPLRDFLDSLRLVRALPDTRLLPAHGPVTESAHSRVDELLEHHDGRLATCYGSITRGAVTAYEAAQMLTWTRHERKLNELNPVNEMLAVLETMSHLDVLALQGRLRVSVIDHVRYYAVTPG